MPPRSVEIPPAHRSTQPVTAPFVSRAQRVTVPGIAIHSIVERMRGGKIRTEHHAAVLNSAA